MVGYDRGATNAWYLCLLRPDRVKRLVNATMTWLLRNLERKPDESIRAMFGDDYYICRFQEPGVAEEDSAKAGIAKLIQLLLTGRDCRAQRYDINYNAIQFSRTGFTGGLNYYPCLDLNELSLLWIGARIEVPVKFMLGDLDLTYHIPGVKNYIYDGEFKQAMPNLEEVVVMEGVAHFLQQEKSREVTAHIHDFIKKFSSL
ncbi:hypothetical protein EUGRSUZ_L02655 [Eucalyptus grandis]|uniref:AB hydrolase-1 domain-containing protein n=1 Tax=Eucalyptus grandis TaxID=71139 RepID=A0AAD9WIR9_EUCGR|nr:hypothetical protein EUGRSUZ_L02655 [Eucalyptus grandis]